MSTVTIKLKTDAVRQGCLVYYKWRVLSVPAALQQGSDDIMLCLHVVLFMKPIFMSDCFFQISLVYAKQDNS